MSEKEKIFEYHPANVVSLNIEDFSGDIELLYRLIVADGRYEIKEFPLHLITNQFVAYLSQLDKLDMDIAADFLKTGTLLVKIKSAAMLVRDEEDIPLDEDTAYEEELLRKRLMVYAIVQENIGRLQEREKLYRLNRKPKFTDADAIIVIEQFNLDGLLDAYGQVLFRVDEKKLSLEIKRIPKDKYPMTEQITKITNIIKEKKKIGFFSLFNADKVEKSEVISSFQALLVLIKNHIVTAEQEDDKEIQIEWNNDVDQESLDFSGMINEAEENK